MDDRVGSTVDKHLGAIFPLQRVPSGIFALISFDFLLPSFSFILPSLHQYIHDTSLIESYHYND